MIKEPMPGAPFQIGDAVLVVAATDANVYDVSGQIGATGRVAALDYDAPGATFPTDPMMVVDLPDGREGFWREELAPAPTGAAS